MLLDIASRMFGRRPVTLLELRWVKRAGWLGHHLTGEVPRAPGRDHIESLAAATNTLGPQRLADEYGESGGTRTPGRIRSLSSFGDLYAWLVQQRRPARVVEFGTAFGVSGMYFCAALDAVGAGHLYTFEINSGWADVAERNLRSVSERFTLTRGTFEDHVGHVVSGAIDLAFVDGIHTYESVMHQFGILRPRMSPGGLIAFDDINFKKPGARMHEAWNEIAASADVVAAVEVARRLGVVELM